MIPQNEYFDSDQMISLKNNLLKQLNRNSIKKETCNSELEQL